MPLPPAFEDRNAVEQIVGAMEHRSADEGFVRGALGGLVYGSFVLLGLEILNNEPEAYLGEPQVGLVFVTTIVGSILGAAGAAYRVRRERELGAATYAAASAGSISCMSRLFRSA